MKNNNKLLNIISSIIKSIDDGFVGIVGPAGVGKTFFSNEIAKILNCHVYSLDFRFIGDSLFRKELLYNKLKSSIDNYIDAVNVTIFVKTNYNGTYTMSVTYSIITQFSKHIKSM